MKTNLRLLVVAIVAFISVGSLAACSSAPSVDIKKYSAVIDVRTPQEYATGHLKGALNIDIEGPDFSAQIEQLDKAASFYIYCHSGNRAGQAINFMEGDGFIGTLTNGGAVEDASSATGLEIVQNY